MKLGIGVSKFTEEEIKAWLSPNKDCARKMSLLI